MEGQIERTKGVINHAIQVVYTNIYIYIYQVKALSFSWQHPSYEGVATIDSILAAPLCRLPRKHGSSSIVKPIYRRFAEKKVPFFNRKNSLIISFKKGHKMRLEASRLPLTTQLMVGSPSGSSQVRVVVPRDTDTHDPQTTASTMTEVGLQQRIATIAEMNPAGLRISKKLFPGTCRPLLRPLFW